MSLSPGGGRAGRTASATGDSHKRIVDSLAVRVLVFLTIALLPIGLIAIQQTRSYQDETRARSELSLIALTAQAAAGERELIERAFGAAEVLGVVIDLFDDPENCSRYLSRFRERRDLYAFIGLIPPSGDTRCSSNTEPIDMAPVESFESWMDARSATVDVNTAGFVSGEWVVVVSQPVFDGDTFEGFISVSIPYSRLREAATIDEGPDQPLQLVLFNRDGDILSIQEPGDEGRDYLPPDINLSAFAGQKPYAFTGVDATDETRVYAFTPIVPGMAYALGAWNPPEEFQPSESGATLLLFPVLMWLASLVVAYYAIDRLVIRHVRGLVSGMNRFGRDRRLPKPSPSAGQARELKQIEEAFLSMAANILQDEAQLENTVRERGILLKEVHHRVKNNLQLISSIMSMQMRRTRDTGTRAILHRLQERVLGLATIHRTLYQDEDMTRVDAARLLREIADQQLAGSATPSLRLNLDTVELLPDQAVPLALLAAEGLANARAHLGRGPEDGRWIEVTLENLPDGRARLGIVNPVTAPDEEERAATGLGLNLIQAFAAQLGTHSETMQADGRYHLSVTFEIRTSQPAALDY